MLTIRSKFRIFNSPKIKNSIATKCFTTDNNIGLLSNKSFANLESALLELSFLSYTLPAYTAVDTETNEIYLSYSSTYNPIVTHRVARQIRKCEDDVYRFISVDAKGKVLSSTIIDLSNHG